MLINKIKEYRNILEFNNLNDFTNLSDDKKQKIEELIIYSASKLQPYLFSNLKNLKTVKFMCNCKNVPDGLFAGCENLQKVYGLQTLSSLGEYAFSNCENLNLVGPFKCLKNVGEGCFFNCIKLEDLQFGASLKNVGNFAFKNNYNLKNLIIYSDLSNVSLGVLALENCTKLNNFSINNKSYFADCYDYDTENSNFQHMGITERQVSGVIRADYLSRFKR